MTGRATADEVICRQCGTANAAADQFCGNCGAFLEWTAEPAAAGELAAAAGPAVDAEPEGSEGATQAAPTTVPAAAPAPTPAMAGSPSAGLVRCPTCGTANVAGKTFCLRCGNKLAGATAATRLALPSRAELIANPAATTPAAATGRVTSGAPRRAERGSRGGRGWLLFAGVGVAVGAIAVVVALSLGSGKAPPPAAASSAPSASVVASQRPSSSPKASPARSAKPTAKPKASK